MKVYVVNLARAADRMAHMRDRLAGVDYERIEAFDGTKDLLPPSALTPNETACYMSHMSAWRQLLASSDKAACVLEDDVVLGDDFGALLAAPLPPHFDLIKIETCHQTVSMDKAALPMGGRHLHRLRSRHLCTAGYIISRACAERLLKIAITEPLDIEMFNHAAARHLCIYQLVPAVCVQETQLGAGDVSSIGARTKNRPRGFGLVVREAERAWFGLSGVIFWPWRRRIEVPFAERGEEADRITVAAAERAARSSTA